MLSKKFEPSQIEEKWYKHWLEKKYFNSKPDERESYTIVIPPPNVTGILHMGHILNNTLQDVIIRKSRMSGFNACWVPGIDHASIATEAKVTEMLKQKGIDKNNLSREEFLKYAFEWKDKHGGIILKQLERLGASCDWDRTKFTMDDDLSESVLDVFIKLYNEGLIYRGLRMINWDIQAQTAVSDEEVVYKEQKSNLYYFKYRIKDSTEHLTIATTRPETILGDSAICVNPNDKRYQHLKGKYAYVPIVDRAIPIIFDEYVDMDFGTGVLKVTPAHDINDYILGEKHSLKIIDVIDNNGKINSTSTIYDDQDRFEARENIVNQLDSLKLLDKQEEIKHSVGFSERTNCIIEPKISTQWFCKMDDMAKVALDAVVDGNIHFYPKNVTKTYKYWMDNIKDWCISRQLWWGQRIPAFFYNEVDFVVAKTAEEALVLAREKSNNVDLAINDLKQDEDVLDTWFSSWLWPISVFDGIRNPDNKEINYYYPTKDLVTGPDILFFWVARMIMSGNKFLSESPFKNVYFTGIVRDNKRRKMSKSLGNSPDPIELINEFGADGVRVGMLLCAPAGNDLLFNINLCEQGRNFSNKIWNAMRLVKGWKVDSQIETPQFSKTAIEWFENRLSEFSKDFENSFNQYRLSESLMLVYRLFWDDFCAFFLEIIKPQDCDIDQATYNKTLDFFDVLLKFLHPFMPFVTEEVWSLLKDRKQDLTISDWPVCEKHDNIILEKFETCKKLISETRNFLISKNVSHNEVVLFFKNDNDLDKGYYDIVSKLTKVIEVKLLDKVLPDYFLININKNQFFIQSNKSINKEEEINKLNKELHYLEGFLKSVESKLRNSEFVSHAPKSVVEIENKKKKDTLDKIQIIKNQIKNIEID